MENSGENINQILNQLKNPDSWWERHVAAALLGQMSQNDELSIESKTLVIDALIEASHQTYEDYEYDQEWFCVKALGPWSEGNLPSELKARVIKKLLESIRNVDDSAMRLVAVGALGAWSKGDLSSELKRKVMHTLQEALQDQSDGVKQNAAAEALELWAKLSSKLKISVIRSMQKAVQNQNEVLGQLAVSSLGSYYDRNLPAELKVSVIQTLVTALRHENSNLRQDAAWALAKWAEAGLSADLKVSVIQSLNEQAKKSAIEAWEKETLKVAMDAWNLLKPASGDEPTRNEKIRKLTLFESIVLGVGGLTLATSVVGFLGIGQVIPWAAISIGSVFSKIAMYAPLLFLLCASIFMHSGFGTSFKYYAITMAVATALTVLSVQVLWQPLYGALGLTSPVLSVAMVSILPALLTLSIDMMVRMCLKHNQSAAAQCQMKGRSHHEKSYMFEASAKKTFAEIAKETIAYAPQVAPGQ